MQSRSGTYALILHARSSGNIDVGRWGRLRVDPGFYVYVGSAGGPGGLRARVSRHFRKHKVRHWHIDYLSEHARPVWAWYSYGTENREHRWARAIGKMMQASAVKGFGCTDCGCHAHLFRMSRKPSRVEFHNAVGGTIESWSDRVCRVTAVAQGKQLTRPRRGRD